eukprot:4290820-Lingulodinium_polyedra.AAC.1
MRGLRPPFGMPLWQKAHEALVSLHQDDATLSQIAKQPRHLPGLGDLLGVGASQLDIEPRCDH